jgi:hypothetical protein
MTELAKDTDHGVVYDSYGAGIGVTGDRSGAVILSYGFTTRMLTPEVWDELDAKVRAAFRPELLTQDGED